MTSGPDAPAGKPCWKLWHLLVAVLTAALAFGATRALAGVPWAILGLATVAMSAGAAVFSLRFFDRGQAVANRVTSGLRRRGLARRGLVGHLARLAGDAVEVGFFLAALAFGLIATLALFLCLAFGLTRLVGL